MFSEACSMDKVDHVHSRLIAFYVICKQDFSTYGVKNPESWTLPSTEKRRSEGERASDFAQVSDNADYVKALFIFRPLMTLYRGVAGGDWRACKHLRDPSDVKVQPLLKWILSRLCMFMYVHHEYGFRYRGPLTKGKLFQFQPLSRGPAGTRWTILSICPLFKCKGQC